MPVSQDEQLQEASGLSSSSSLGETIKAVEAQLGRLQQQLQAQHSAAQALHSLQATLHSLQVCTEDSKCHRFASRCGASTHMDVLMDDPLCNTDLQPMPDTPCRLWPIIIACILPFGFRGQRSANDK